MKTDHCEISERLIRVLVSRRGKPTELSVHYEKTFIKGCNIYRMVNVKDAHAGTASVDFASGNAINW